MAITIRPATTADASSLGALVVDSVRELSAGYYAEEEIERALARVLGLDTLLIEDGTYYVAEVDGTLAGCGGWGKRRTLYGGDQACREDAELEPGRDAARIRAFFVSPSYARKGVGRSLLRACEEAARACGFTRAELVATLPGVPLYAAHGYEPLDEVNVDLGDGFVLRCVRMGKAL